jgi:hypothetical protein
LENRKAQAQGSQNVREKIDHLRQQIEELTRKGDFNKVAELQYGKLPELEKLLKETQAKGIEPCCRSQLLVYLRTQVGAEEIAEVVSRATGIPVSKMMQGEREKLLQMEDQIARARGGSRRGHRRGLAMQFVGLVQVCLIPRARRVHFCFWAQQVLVKQNCVKPWLASCLTAKTTSFALT